MRRFLIAAIAASLVGAFLVPAAPAAAASHPMIQASLTSDWIASHGGGFGAAVDVTVVSASGGSKYEALGVATGMGGFPPGGFFQETGVDLVAGDTVTVTDGTLSASVTLVELTFDVFDIDRNLTRGTAVIGQDVDVGVGDETGGSSLFPTAMDAGRADGLGIWVADFGAAGFDITPTMGGGVSVADGEGDTTFADSPGPPGADDVGLVDTFTGEWFLMIADPGAPEGFYVNLFFFGNPGDAPVMGDWDCDGISTPGLFRQSDAFAYLRNSNTQGIADTRFFFGDPSDVPLAGDWNGNGCDTLSIYRPSEQRFYIINNLGQDEGGLGAADFSFLFGNPGDKPVVGDWDGDGIDEVGLHRESTGFFYWRDTLDTGIASGEIFFGDPNDRFVSGDWGIVDGIDTPAIFRPSDAIFYFRHTLTEGAADSQLDSGGRPFALPVAGRFCSPC